MHNPASPIARPAAANNAAISPSPVSERLIVFARYPHPGQAKTRLIPALGAERAAQLQDALTRRTLGVANDFCSARRCQLEVRCSGAGPGEMAQQYGRQQRYVAQQGADLGERIDHAASAAFSDGAERVVIIGADCPALEPPKLEEAFLALQASDVVFGPANDGGYYLVGLSRPQPELFREISWSTEKVLEQSVAKAHALNCKVRLLPSLSDVDYPEDLIACRRYPADFAQVLPRSQPGLLSIIIPALNEERTIAETIRPLMGISDVEVIVADGDSSDATVSIARDLGAIVVAARRGRGRQMNAGAALSSGETLLFLHADSKLPPNYLATIHSLLSERCLAGAFRLHIAAPGWQLRWVERAANLRSRVLQLPYGDQGLFMRAESFYQIGGYPNWPLLEDYELCRRLRKQGTIWLATDSVSTSARRWRKLGAVRTTLINQSTLLGFHLGISPEQLARWYTTWMK
jgi:uncharacterized protein